MISGFVSSCLELEFEIAKTVFGLAGSRPTCFEIAELGLVYLVLADLELTDLVELVAFDRLVVVPFIPPS